jgi:hypothetical protein
MSDDDRVDIVHGLPAAGGCHGADGARLVDVGEVMSN